VPLFDDPKKIWQRGPSWSPDGNWIAYYSLNNGKPAILKIRVGANRAPELVTQIAVTNPVRWSPRGDWIAWNDNRKLTLVSPDGKHLVYLQSSGAKKQQCRHLNVWRTGLAFGRSSFSC